MGDHLSRCRSAYGVDGPVSASCGRARRGAGARERRPSTGASATMPRVDCLVSTARSRRAGVLRSRAAGPTSSGMWTTASRPTRKSVDRSTSGWIAGRGCAVHGCQHRPRDSDLDAARDPGRAVGPSVHLRTCDQTQSSSRRARQVRRCSPAVWSTGAVIVAIDSTTTPMSGRNCRVDSPNMAPELP